MQACAIFSWLTCHLCRGDVAKYWDLCATLAKYSRAARLPSEAAVFEPVLRPRLQQLRRRGAASQFCDCDDSRRSTSRCYDGILAATVAQTAPVMLQQRRRAANQCYDGAAVLRRQLTCCNDDVMLQVCDASASSCCDPLAHPTVGNTEIGR